MRDLCCDLGLAVVADDIWGSDITTAALTHLASTTDLTDYVAVSLTDGCLRPRDGCISASEIPGLRFVPAMGVIVPPVAEIT